MSQPIELKVTWASVLNTNKSVVADVIKAALAMAPELPETGDTSKIALAAVEKKGFENALKAVFSTIPGDRTMPTESKFMDMTN